MKKAVVVLGLSKLTIPQKIEFARFIVTSMTGNANFTTPNPALLTITTNANALETAHIAAKGGGKDETAAMHAKEQLLDLSLKLLAAYVEGIANANPANAEAIALSSGMNTKKNASPRPNGFRVEHGKNAGEVNLRTNADDRAVFVWETTTTPDDEATWTTLNSSTRAHYLATGLNSGTRYYFRVAKIDKDGQGDWSNVLNIIVT